MAKANGTFRIGTGAGFSADRLDPAVDLAKRGQLHVMVLECLGSALLLSPIATGWPTHGVAITLFLNSA